MEDLLAQIKAELAARKGDEWYVIAKKTRCSYSVISKLGLDSYPASPTYRTLSKIAEYIKRHPRRSVA